MTNLCTIMPTFTVHDIEKARPVMDDFIAKTRTEKSCVYYGWELSEDGKKLFCYEAYADASGVLAHLGNVDSAIKAILAEGVCSLDRIHFTGPSAELAKLKEPTAALNPVMLETHSDFNNFSKATGGDEGSLSPVSIHPHFEILDMAKAEPIMRDFLARTRNEKGALYYGWCLSGSHLYCREAYINGDAANEHLVNVGPCISALLADGVAKLTEISIMGPAAEIEKTKAGTSALGTTYYAAAGGFTKFA